MRDLEQVQRRAVPMLITSPDPYKLRALLTQEHQRRAILVRSDIHEVEQGVWGVKVLRLRPLRRPWVRPAMVTGGTVTVLAGSAAAGWWAASLAIVVPAAVLVVLALIVAVVGLASPGTRRGGCEIHVHVSHRHR